MTKDSMVAETYLMGNVFSCHNFGHNAAQCVVYKNIMTREGQNQRDVIGTKKSSYNNFLLLKMK